MVRPPLLTGPSGNLHWRLGASFEKERLTRGTWAALQIAGFRAKGLCGKAKSLESRSELPFCPLTLDGFPRPMPLTLAIRFDSLA